MSELPRYHMRRGQGERIVDVVAVDRAPTDVARRLARGSQPALTPPPLSDVDALAALAAPATPSVAPRSIRFGGTMLVIEFDGHGVSLVVPGALRLTGSVAEAQNLATELSRLR